MVEVAKIAKAAVITMNPMFPLINGVIHRGIRAEQVVTIAKLNKKENRIERDKARIRNKNNYENTNGKLCTVYN